MWQIFKIAEMIESLRRNKELLKRTSYFNNAKKQHVEKKARHLSSTKLSTEFLEKIEQQLDKEIKRNRIQTKIMTIIFSILLLLFLIVGILRSKIL